MKFCQNCGAELGVNQDVCLNCGTMLNKIEQTVNIEDQSSKNSFGWGVLGFFIPLVGLILYLVWMDNRKKDSKAAGLGAMIGAICYVVIPLIISFIMWLVAVLIFF